MARTKRKDIESMAGRKKYFHKNSLTEEPATAPRVNAGIKARLLGTCCLGGSASATTSPMGSKPRVEDGWEDCPAFDLEPTASRQASTVENNTAKYRSSSPYCLQPRQVPVGEAEQVPLNSHPGSPDRVMAVNSLSSPQVPTTSAEVMTPVMAIDADDSRVLPAADNDTCSPMTANFRPQAPTQDSAAEIYNSDNDILPAAESPLPHSSLPERQTLQHRVALRLLERRGVLPEGGRTSNSGSPISPSSNGDGASSAFNHLQQMPSSPQATSSSSTPHGSALGSGMLLVSPNSAPRTVSTEYYSALSSPVAIPKSSPGGNVGEGGEGTTLETALGVDERVCLREEEYEPLGVQCDGYRMSAPGYAIPRIGLQGRAAWTGSNLVGIDSLAPGVAVAERSTTTGSASATDDLLLRMRGSDFGGTMPTPICVRTRGLRATANTANGDLQASRGTGVVGSGATPRSAIIVVEPDATDDDIVMGAAQRRTRPPPAWSAAGGRDELSQEEKEWLFTQTGGIGGLSPVMSLGEGGEGLVDLVRLELPGRTVHLARKATRTCLPAFALSATGSGTAAAAATMLGLRSQQKVSYSFPFEFFDREVKAMKAVKDSGFVIRFQAAAYDHEAGQGFILMEAAPYGTLEDLHAALCRSHLQPVQQQRPALLQRAMARLNFGNAKSSAPPSLMGASAATVVPAAAAYSTRSCTPNPPSPTVTGNGDRPSLPRTPGAGGIGSCGDSALETGAVDRDRVSCCSNLGMVNPLPGPTAAVATDGSGSGGDSAAAMEFAALGSCLMSTRALKYYGACMLQALVALHEAGYVYRDLKMSNVMLCEGGRVRLTDFGAASPCLAEQPGLFGGAAGTRAYLAPEVVPWLGNGGKGGKHSSGTGGGAGPEPYTITVDSWTWGLMMVELATGWSLKELTQRVIRRVCAPRGPEVPDLPPHCGLPPTLRQLLLDHILVRDPRERWPAARIRTHRFFEGIVWGTLAEVEGPHAHLFARGRLVNTPPPLVVDSPDAVAAAMVEGEMMANRRGSRSTGMASPAAVAAIRNTLASGGGDAAVGEGTEGNVVVPFGHRLSSGRPSYTGGGAGGPPSPRSPGLLSPSGVTVSPVGGSGAAAAGLAGGRISGLLSPAASPAGAGSGRISGAGFNSPLSGVASGLRISSSGNGPLIGPVVMTPGTPTSPASGFGSGLLAAAGIAVPGGLAISGSGRRHTSQGTVGSSRLSSGAYLRQLPAAPPLTPLQFPQQVAAAD